MALPLLNENPEYEMIIPSKQQKVNFRPFLVKEQKVLLLAFESKDRNQILKAMMNTIDACVHSDVDVRSLPSFDIDYMFTQIRAKSVGETADVKMKCNKCEHQTTVNIKIEEIEPPKNIEKEIIIELNDKYSLEMQYPNYASLFDTLGKEENQTEIIMKFMIECMTGLLTDEERISMKDEPLSEKQKFLESLNASQFEKLTNFINTMPTLTHDVHFDCEACGEPNQHTLRGLEDFFL